MQIWGKRIGRGLINTRTISHVLCLNTLNSLYEEIMRLQLYKQKAIEGLQYTIPFHNLLQVWNHRYLLFALSSFTIELAWSDPDVTGMCLCLQSQYKKSLSDGPCMTVTKFM